MKKKFTLVASFVLALSLQAQQAVVENSRWKEHSEKLLKVNIESLPVRSKHALPSPSDSSVDVHQTPRVSPHRLYAPNLRAEAEAARRDTSLATGMSAYRNSNENSELVDSVRIVYDEYGRRKLLLRRQGECIRYTYQVGPENMWTERVLEYADNTSGVFPDESLTGLQFMYHTKVVRHINSELNVEKEAAYFFDTEKNEWQMEYELTYDYAHLFMDDDNQLRRGHVVKAVYRNEVLADLRYEWLEAARQYIDMGQESATSKRVVELGTDSYTSTTYYRDSPEGAWNINDKAQFFFAEGVRLGKYYIDYSDGKVDRVEGERYAYEKDQSAAHAFTLTKYAIQKDGADGVKEKATYKYDFRGCQLTNDVVKWIDLGRLGIAGSRTSWGLNEQTGQWDFRFREVVQAYEHGFWSAKRYDEAGQEIEEYAQLAYLTRSGVWDYGVVKRLPDKSYVVRMERTPQEFDGWYDQDKYFETYARFTADYRREKVFYKSNGEFYHAGSAHVVSFPEFYEIKEGKDVKLRQAEVMDQYGTCDFIRYTYNEEGRPLTVDWMTGDQVAERTAYVYGENRFEENRYKGEALTYQESYEQLPDGTRRETRIACNGSTDRIEMAARVDQTPDGWVRQYTYDNQLKDFVLKYSQPGTWKDFLSDGITVTTEFEQQGEVVVPTKKRKTWTEQQGYMKKTFEESALWDAATQTWVNHTKTLNAEVEVENAYFNPDPTGYLSYDDEYWDLTREEVDELSSSYNISHGAYYEWAWNEETQRWDTGLTDLDNAMTLSQPDAHTYHIVIRQWNKSDQFVEHKDYIYQIDDARRLLARHELKYVSGETSGKKWTAAYDVQGHLIKTVEEDFDRWSKLEKVQHFYYTTLQIFPTAEGIEEAKAADAGLRVEGRQVVAADSQTLIRLYTVDGRQVATGHGRVEVPASGVYVARTANGSCKLLAR